MTYMDIDTFKKDLNKCVDSLKEDLSQIRTGRAAPELIQDILINVYETEAPLKNYATINVADTRSLIVIPWDKTIIENIAKGLSSANMGFSIVSEGDHVRVSVPELTEERRKEYVKVMKERVEDARVAVRQVRQNYRQEIDEALKDSYPEEEAERFKEEIEKLVKEINVMIEEIKEKKENELMTI
jgi:ribosome recycling factor